MRIVRNRRASVQEAFTLLEVMVSAAVLAIVMTVMLSALSTSLSLWRNTDNKIVADREARAVKMLLVRDFANIVIPPSTNLWPRVDMVGATQFLKFLTTAPSEYQSTTGADVGDVCYVEYAVLPASGSPGREVRRFFWGSVDTYNNVLRVNGFPSTPQDATNYQSLGLNILPSNNMAARGLGPLVTEANNTNFVLLGTNMLPFTGVRSISNFPVAIEVNFSVADADTMANSNVIARTNFVLRNAGLYSFRIPLPKPQGAP